MAVMNECSRKLHQITNTQRKGSRKLFGFQMHDDPNECIEQLFIGFESTKRSTITY